MIGARIDVEWDRFDYVFGLLVDEGLVPEEDFMAAGGSTLIVREEAWDRLDDDVQREVYRFLRPSSEVQVVAGVQPADSDDSGAASPVGGARSRARRPVVETTEGAH